MKRVFVLILMVLVFPKCAYQLKISEIMFNPEGDDAYSEYIELFNDENTTINLSSYLLCNYSIIPGYVGKGNLPTTANTTLLPPRTYALVVDGGTGSDVLEKFNLSNATLIFHTNTSYLCGRGLKNDGMNITLLSMNGTTLDSVSYDAEMNREGYSIQLCNKVWIVAPPTPLAKNACNTTRNTTVVTLELKIENLSCFICNESQPVTYKLCLYPNTSSFGRDMNITVSYWISDLRGRKVKKPYNTTLKAKATSSKICTSKRVWTPSKLESEVFFIRARMANTLGDVYIPAKEASAMLIVRRENAEAYENESATSFVRIERVNKAHLKFGEILRVKIRASRGNNKKRTVYIYVKNPKTGKYASERLSLQLMEKNKEYSISLPIQLKPNCNGRLKGGTYVLWADASWGDADTIKLTIEDGPAKFCKRVVKSSCSCKMEDPGSFVHEERRETPFCRFVEVENISTQPAVLSGGNLGVRITIRNRMNRSINISAYSYILCGRKLATKGGWKSNEISVKLENNTITNITLKNSVRKVDEAKLCTLKIKLVHKNQKCVVEKPVFLLNFSTEQSSSHKNLSDSGKNYEHISPPFRGSHNALSSALIYDATPVGKIKRLVKVALVKLLDVL